jgi:GntR family transcriptional regulator/MocR family aminotransferase
MIDLGLLLKGRLAAPDARPLRRRLAAALKQAVLDGTLAAASVLPASRVLARELGCGRNTVLHAYEELAAEGYVVADRQGTVVSHLPTAAPVAGPGLPGRSGASQPSRPPGPPGPPGPPSRPAPALPPLSARSALQLPSSENEQENLAPLMPGVPALAEFPLRRWQRRVAQAWRAVSVPALGGGGSAGAPVLRAAIAAYLRAARGVRCDAEQVVITSGTQESLGLCAQLLADPGERAWMEHPGYIGARAAFAAAGLRAVPVPVDAQGLAPPPALWKRSPPRLIYATPSHQYPLGVVLSLPRRLSLIEAARAAGAWILEDDYDSEFCRGVPLSAMQGLVADAPVVYLGTFNKTMFPALRLGFAVFPQAALDAVLPALDWRLVAGRPLEQEALAAFIQEGDYTAHLRRMRRLYAEREQALREALQRHWPLPFALSPGHGGIHLALTLPAGVPDQALVRAAWQRGLAPRALSAFSIGSAAPVNGLVMGYANVAAGEAERVVVALAQLVRRMSGRAAGVAGRA